MQEWKRWIEELVVTLERGDRVSLILKKQFSIPTVTFLGRETSRCSVLRCAAAAAKSRQSCLTLCDLIDISSPGSSVPEILQTRIQEWVAISFSM